VIIFEPGNNCGQVVEGFNTMRGMPTLITTGAEVIEVKDP
jgi:hypothetical protein